MLLEDVDFNDSDLGKYRIRNPNKATQTDIFDDNNSLKYSSVAPSQSINTPSEIERHEQQQRQTSTSNVGPCLLLRSLIMCFQAGLFRTQQCLGRSPIMCFDFGALKI